MFFIVVLISLGMYAAGFHVLRLLLRRWVGLQTRRPLGPPPPDAWNDVIARHVPLAARLTGEQRERHLRQVQDLVQTRRWEGCGGLELTEEMRIAIAAQACILTVERPGDPFPSIDEILVYPHTFVPRSNPWRFDGPEAPRRPTLGQAWSSGVIILAWDSVRSGATNPFDGQNVTLHEFAHALDAEHGGMDGTPLLGEGSAYAAWADLLEREHERLTRDEWAGRRSVLDHYGATNHAELFAVATEAFFEKGRQLANKHPELYSALRDYYRQDPANAAPGTPPGGHR